MTDIQLSLHFQTGPARFPKMKDIIDIGTNHVSSEMAIIGKDRLLATKGILIKHHSLYEKETLANRHVGNETLCVVSAPLISSPSRIVPLNWTGLLIGFAKICIWLIV